MELIPSSTDDVASNIDGDVDIAAFDTDLPAEHNVSIAIKEWMSQLMEAMCISVPGWLGAGVRCWVPRTEQIVHDTDYHSQFIGFPGWNVAHDFIATHVSAGW